MGCVMIYKSDTRPVQPVRWAVNVSVAEDSGEVFEVKMGSRKAILGRIARRLRMPVGLTSLDPLDALVLDGDLDCSAADDCGAEIMIRPAQTKYWITHSP